ncbi:MAG: hypothetical protein ACON5F_12645 [Jejuia sp.]
MKIWFYIFACGTWPLIFSSCSKNEFSETKSTDNIEVSLVTALGGSLNESFNSIIKTADGGYAVLGHVQSNDGDFASKTNTSFDYWVIKYDSNHNLQWQKNYGGTGDDRGKSIVVAEDGGFTILGSSNSADGDVTENFGNSDFWVLKLSALGEILWETSFGFSGIDNGTKLIQTNDNGLLLVGVLDVTASNGQGNTKTASTKRHAGGDYWAIKISASGTAEWTKFFGGSFTDTAYDVIQTNDNGYLVVGSSDSNDVDISENKGTYDFWVVKISESGTKLWEKSYGGSEIDEAWGIVSSNDGNYIIVGDTRSNDKDVLFNNGAADIFVVKIDPDGNIIWRKSFGGSSFDTARSIAKASDGGFIIAGSSRSADGNITSNNGQNDALVIKLNSEGDLQWQHTLGGNNIDQAFDAIQLENGNIIVVGESSSSDIDISENKGFNDALIYQLTQK